MDKEQNFIWRLVGVIILVLLLAGVLVWLSSLLPTELP
jgi:hypothetical protein